MTYSHLLDEYAGLNVVELESEDSWQGPGVCYRLREEYEDEFHVTDRLDLLVQQPGVEQLSALIIGHWAEAYEGGADPIVDKLVELAPRLPGLRSLMFGDITFEECEISWIIQTDMSPLLRAFPQLIRFGVRGANDLSFSRISHSQLQELTIESGGLGKSVLQEVFQCEFPALTHLELQLGSGEYGFDATVDDLQPVLSGELYPHLRSLGLTNSEITDEIAAVVANSPIIDRIEALDLSLGTLTVEGLRSLQELKSHPNVKRLNISHLYATEADVQELVNAVPCEVIADDLQSPDKEWRSCVHAE